jgi:hypothetical protein
MDTDDFTVDSARDAAGRGALAAWVRGFLASPGSDNAELGRLLAERPGIWVGPMRLPIDRLHRLAGPADAPVLCPVDEDEWRDDVEEMRHCVEDGWVPPPVVVTFRDKQFVVEDGNHRIESMRRAGEVAAWSVVHVPDPADLDHLVTSLG